MAEGFHGVEPLGSGLTKVFDAPALESGQIFAMDVISTTGATVGARRMRQGLRVWYKGRAIIWPASLAPAVEKLKSSKKFSIDCGNSRAR
jgi:hypothetical protein